MGASCGKGSVSQKTVVSPVKSDQRGLPANTEQRLQPKNNEQKKNECPQTEAVRESQGTKGEKEVPTVEQSNEIEKKSCNAPIENAKQNDIASAPEAQMLNLEQKGLAPPKVFTVIEQVRLVMHQFGLIQRPLDRYVFLMALQVCEACRNRFAIQTSISVASADAHPHLAHLGPQRGAFLPCRDGAPHGDDALHM